MERISPNEYVFTTTPSGVYLHHPDRDMAAEWAKARRKFRTSMRRQSVPKDTVLSRFMADLNRKLKTHPSITVTLYEPGPDQFNREVEGFATAGQNIGRVCIRYIDQQTGETVRIRDLRSSVYREIA